MTRQTISLNGPDWRLGRAPAAARPDIPSWSELDAVDDWLPATVPGNVRADLLRAGRLPDLAWADGPKAAQWVDDHSWWLVRDWHLAPTPGQRVHLVLRGADYVADLFLNGQFLGRHEGMFSPQVYDVTALLRGDNRLAVRLLGSRWLPHGRSSPWEKLLNHLEARVVSVASGFPHRRDTLKCQMGFGWDFAPPLRTMGLWDDVYAVVVQDVFIHSLVVRQQHLPGRVLLAVDLDLDSVTARSVQATCHLQGETFEGPSLVTEQRIELRPGVNRALVVLAVDEPRLWWPWDHGRPDLYRLSVELRAGATLLDSLSQTVGLRDVALEGWRLSVNGRVVYARGANWVPADLLPGRVEEGDYRALLTLAREANMNTLRVWGGGLREKRAFYDLCDGLGFLVWQEFPFACAFLTRFPRGAGYLCLVEAEARSIVRDLRQHPCLALWCGGNEFRPERNLPLVTTLCRVVADEDPDRPFLPASPAGGDSHFWHVWHSLRPPSAYRHDHCSFASEFGLQAPPSPAALRRFLPAADLWPPGRLWAYHGAQLPKLWRYARPFLRGKTVDLEAFVHASQQAQAHALQIAIEHYRRAQARGHGGALVWQLNEPWPAISWALVDYGRSPKLAYAAVRRAFSPLLVSLEYPLRAYHAGDLLDMTVWLINDTPRALPGALVEVTLRGAGGPLSHQATLPADLAPTRAAPAGQLAWVLPPGDSWRLDCRLLHDGELLSTNEYELGVHDDIQPTPRQRLWAWLSSLVMPS